MPTDLPPDYKPAKPGEGKGAPEPPAGGGEDVKGHPQPGDRAGPTGGVPGRNDDVDPTGRKSQGGAGPDVVGIPNPAGLPTF